MISTQQQMAQVQEEAQTLSDRLQRAESAALEARGEATQVKRELEAARRA